MLSPHNFTTEENFLPDRYSKLFLAQHAQFLFLLTFIFSISFFLTPKNIRFFSVLSMFSNIFIASFACIEDMMCVIVFKTPVVSQVSNCAASFRKHLRHGLFFTGITLKTYPLLPTAEE